jgi:hypothetical protein
MRRGQSVYIFSFWDRLLIGGRAIAKRRRRPDQEDPALEISVYKGEVHGK